MLILTALMFGGEQKVTPVRFATDASYDFFVPKSCIGKIDIQSWSKGHSQFKADAGDFLNMKARLEACGGRVELTK